MGKARDKYGTKFKALHMPISLPYRGRNNEVETCFYYKYIKMNNTNHFFHFHKGNEEIMLDKTFKKLKEIYSSSKPR